jgi:hypothetical protein
VVPTLGVAGVTSVVMSTRFIPRVPAIELSAVSVAVIVGSEPERHVGD